MDSSKRMKIKKIYILEPDNSKYKNTKRYKKLLTLPLLHSLKSSKATSMGH